MSIEKEKIIEAYNFRHACKEFNPDKKISDDDFNFILETARLSPSSFGFEPWKFIIVQNAALREKLSPVSWGAQKKLETASHFVIILARKKSDMIYNSKYISEFMYNVQHLPEDIAKGKESAYEDFQKNDFKLLESDRSIFDWSSKQTYIALGNMLTSAAEIGIDSCPIEGYNKEKVEDILESEGILDKNKFGVSIMAAFGYRKVNPIPKTRQSLEKITEWIK
ncbi:NAD(P)H-dependent oxidoreductase [Clostridium sp.]|jgi:nitroreductase|uniref:NAD(P)H-dependent oxidoreductase n=1 Tax=Clostridium sp. TaxID=1506 RepID=UPI002588659C|nr:NAD(P)H-dependent oxidoreductase [Clostridium sp.]MDF2504293.1 nitroreductase [Clostridium sp.]